MTLIDALVLYKASTCILLILNLYKIVLHVLPSSRVTLSMPASSQPDSPLLSLMSPTSCSVCSTKYINSGTLDTLIDCYASFPGSLPNLIFISSGKVCSLQFIFGLVFGEFFTIFHTMLPFAVIAPQSPLSMDEVLATLAPTGLPVTLTGTAIWPIVLKLPIAVIWSSVWFMVGIIIALLTVYFPVLTSCTHSLDIVEAGSKLDSGKILFLYSVLDMQLMVLKMPSIILHVACLTPFF